MITYPINWKQIGIKITLIDIEKQLIQIIKELNCNCLALSGGVDSSLMLYFMTKIFRKNIKTFTIALNEKHPDYIYSNIAINYFKVKGEIYTPRKIPKRLKNDCSGDEIVRMFYNNLKLKKIKKIIACDGIDEFTGGYYEHMKYPNEKTYYKFIRKLQKKQLEPLNRNSNDIEVLLPYIDSNLILLLSQIPLSEKVDKFQRKKIIYNIAKDKIPLEILERRKYGFCDAMIIKENKS